MLTIWRSLLPVGEETFFGFDLMSYIIGHWNHGILENNDHRKQLSAKNKKSNKPKVESLRVNFGLNTTNSTEYY